MTSISQSSYDCAAPPCQAWSACNVAICPKARWRTWRSSPPEGWWRQARFFPVSGWAHKPKAHRWWRDACPGCSSGSNVPSRAWPVCTHAWGSRGAPCSARWWTAACSSSPLWPRPAQSGRPSRRRCGPSRRAWGPTAHSSEGPSWRTAELTSARCSPGSPADGSPGAAGRWCCWTWPWWPRCS